MNGEVLEKVYQENLAVKIITCLAAEQNLSLEKAMNLYYTSRIAGLIERGEYDIQYLDYKILAGLICEEAHI